MKKRILTIITCLAVLLSLTVPSSALYLDAKSAILIDADSGTVLYEKDADKKRAPASMTKMMTAILTVENLDLDEKVTVSKHVTTIGGSAIGLKKGEKIKVRDLLGAMLVYSANDCAVCLGESISGSEEEFAKLMTKRAKELGCTNTTFKNPSGLDQKGHISTARDMAIIAKKAVEYEEIKEIVCMTTYKMSKTNKRKAVTVGSTDRLLFDTYSWITVDGKSRHPYYKYACGIKTGYTESAGGCLATLAEKNGKRLISVVMKSTDMKRFSSAIKILEYGFDNFEKKQVTEKGEKTGTVSVKWGKEKEVDAVAEETYTILVKKNDDTLKTEEVYEKNLKAPIKKGDKIGTLKVYVGEKEEGSINLLAGEDIEQSFIGKIIENKKALVIAVMIVLVIAVTVFALMRKKGEKEKENV